MNLLRTLRTSAAALLVASAAVVGATVATTTSAHAASCTGNTGVTVVVDYGSLGGVTAGCAPRGGGQFAEVVFPAAGYPLTYAQQSDGFVCRVSGLPTDDPCADAAPSDRYWSLWWADGKGGGWVYSSRGVASLMAREGGYVALKFHTGGGHAMPPAAAATARQAAPAPTPTAAKPTQGGKKQPTKKPKTTAKAPAQQQTAFTTGAPDATPTASVSASASASASATPSPSATTSAPAKVTPTATASASASVVPAADAITAGPNDVKAVSAEKGDSLPLWIPIVVVVALLGAAGTVAARRRAH